MNFMDELTKEFRIFTGLDGQNDSQNVVKVMYSSSLGIPCEVSRL